MRVIVVGLFSAKDADAPAVMDAIAAQLARDGHVVVGRVVQRRGVSRAPGPGGARRMGAAMDPATYIGRGKADELARLRAETGAELVVMHGTPSASQLDRLRTIVGCDVRRTPSR